MDFYLSISKDLLTNAINFPGTVTTIEKKSLTLSCIHKSHFHWIITKSGYKKIIQMLTLQREALMVFWGMRVSIHPEKWTWWKEYWIVLRRWSYLFWKKVWNRAGEKKTKRRYAKFLMLTAWISKLKNIKFENCEILSE